MREGGRKGATHRERGASEGGSHIPGEGSHGGREGARKRGMETAKPPCKIVNGYISSLLLTLNESDMC